MKKGKGPMREVDCEFKYNRPQPLINVINTLMEESSRQDPQSELTRNLSGQDFPVFTDCDFCQVRERDPLE